MKKSISFLTLLLILLGCQNQNHDSISTENKQVDSENLIRFVNPFTGTKSMGHTYPGATAPFGMVQLSPQTNLQSMYNSDGTYNPEVYRYCSGYQYEDSTIFGFGHTHFSGTGHSDLGDFLIMPATGALVTEPGNSSTPGSGYYSKFSHESEYAEPGYYRVELDDYKIVAELTATERVGFHQYTFPESDSASIILDMVSNIYNYEGKNVWTFVRVENDSLVTGYRQTTGWARTRTVYFAMQFSKPFQSYGQKKYDKVQYNGFYRKFDETKNFPEMAGREIRAYFRFSTADGEKIKIKFALSPVSTSGAVNNLEEEVPGWDFEEVKKATQKKWNNELAKIIAETETPEQKTTFYTALYHTMLSPVVYEDADGSYRGLDQNIYQSEGFTNYTVFSLWDTYRALHPLFNIIQPQRNNDMVKSMLAHYDQSVHRMLPVWSHYANENWCMIGYHSVSVIADAIAKGTTDADLERTLEAAVTTSKVPYFDGIGSYMEHGYVPEDLSPNSVSKTLEYAYDDWCIARIALASGNKSIYEEYMNRSNSYKNVYDSGIGYMRPKLSDGTWRTTFDPIDTHGQGFIEGNALNYGLYVPQEIDSMIAMMGGKDKFSAHLDMIFNTEIEDKYIEKNEDITRDGIIGNYVHGNEPGHHIPYLYNWTNDPWKTQARVRMIMETMYSDREDGLCGNDDAGQMSAWYIFSSLGFYPVTPGSTVYALGSPSIVKATIRLDNGKVLTINTVSQSRENVYVEKVEINGKIVKGKTIDHSDIMNGGTITFHMSNKPVLN